VRACVPAYVLVYMRAWVYMYVYVYSRKCLIHRIL